MITGVPLSASRAVETGLVRELAVAFALVMTVTGCRDEGDELPQDWSFEATTAVAPVVRDSTLYAAYSDGLVVAHDARTGGVRWTRRLPAPVRGERLLVADSILVVPETQLFGLDRRTGAVRWQYAGPTGTTGISAPVLSGDTLFVSDRSGQASAISARTGQEFWATSLGYVPFTPTLAGDLVLFAGRRAVNNVLADGDIVALDRATGAERWRFHLTSEPGDPYRGGATNSGLVIGNRVIIGSESAVIYGLDRATGAELWRVDGGSPGNDAWTYVPVEYGGDAVLFRINGVLQALDPETGAQAWSRDLTQGSTTLNGPVRCGNWICLSSGRFWIVGPGGAVEWSYGGGGTGDAFLGEPAVDSAGNVFVGLTRGLRGYLVRFTPPVRVGPTP